MGEVTKMVETYKDIFTQLKNRFRWSFSDARILMMVASLYVTNKRQFDIDRFEQLCNYMKDEVGMFSTLKSQSRFTIAAMLDTRFDSPKEKFAEYLKLYEALIQEGFGRGIFSYIAAMVLLSEEGNQKELAILGKSVYRKMREKHLFLTGQSDYPLAMLLAQRAQNTDELIEYVEGFYHKLNDAGFRKGNDLQSMSHILSLQDATDQDVVVNRCTELFDAMKQVGVKTKAMYYPQIALLSFLEDGKHQIQQVNEIAKTLNAEKQFKWHKDINFMMAVTFHICDKLENKSMLQTSLYTTIEVLIQAQQAATFAAVSATTAASSASNGQ